MKGLSRSGCVQLEGGGGATAAKDLAMQYVRDLPCPTIDNTSVNARDARHKRWHPQNGSENHEGRTTCGCQGERNKEGY